MEGQGTKEELGAADDPSWLKDPKVEVSSHDAVGHPFDTNMTYDEALAATMDPNSALYGMEIPADLVFAEESDEDADWDDVPEMEVNVDVDIDVEVEVDMDTDVDSESDDDGDSTSVIWPEY